MFDILFSHVGLLNAYSLMEKEDHDLKEIEEWGDRLNNCVGKNQSTRKEEFLGMRNGNFEHKVPFFEIVQYWDEVFQSDWLDKLKGQWKK